MKILVTGGSGFLGSHLIPKLVEDGHVVFALARSATSGDTVRSLGATPVQGDLEDPDQLSLPAVDAVVHAAALFRFAGPRAPTFAPTSLAQRRSWQRLDKPAPPRSSISAPAQS